MPRYTFRLRDDDTGQEDDTGVSLLDDEIAYRYACDVVHGLMQHREQDTRSWQLEVFEGEEAVRDSLWLVSIPPSTTAGPLIGTPGLRNRFSKAHPHPRKANHLGAFLGVVHVLREG